MEMRLWLTVLYISMETRRVRALKWFDKTTVLTIMFLKTKCFITFTSILVWSSEKMNWTIIVEIATGQKELTWKHIFFEFCFVSIGKWDGACQGAILTIHSNIYEYCLFNNNGCKKKHTPLYFSSNSEWILQKKQKSTQFSHSSIRQPYSLQHTTS